MVFGFFFWDFVFFGFFLFFGFFFGFGGGFGLGFFIGGGGVDFFFLLFMELMEDFFFRE